LANDIFMLMFFLTYEPMKTLVVSFCACTVHFGKSLRVTAIVTMSVAGS